MRFPRRLFAGLLGVCVLFAVFLGVRVLSAGHGRYSPPASVNSEDGEAAHQASVSGADSGTPLDGGQEEEDGGIPASTLGFIRPLNGRLFRRAGEEDVMNRYPFAVMVKTHAPMAAGVGGECSGVLISHELVLTAGHCVCVRRKDIASEAGGRFIIDGSACNGTAAVVTVSYENGGEGRGAMTTRTHVYRGDVRPHPKLKILIDQQGNVLSSDADLAVIVLSKRVEEAAVATLTDAEVGSGETVVIVSYGYDEVIGGIDGQRRFKTYKVGNPSSSNGGRVTFDQPNRKLYKGDSGGPVLFVKEGKTLLEGISTAGLGEEATFVSAYFYRDWLAAELQRAKRVDSPAGGK